jgi:hypothetical protein
LPPLRFLAAIGVLAGGWPRWAAAAAPSAQDLAGEAIRRLGLQVELPRSPSPPEWSLDLPDVALWAVVAVALAVLAYYLKDIGWRRQADAIELAEQHAEAAARQSGHMARAERFAQQGAFVDAMHELLLEGLRQIRERAGEQLADSLTSREILRTTLLPEQGRAALRAIILRVEWTYFGEHAATLADYRACRESFDALHAALLRAPGA